MSDSNMTKEEAIERLSELGNLLFGEFNIQRVYERMDTLRKIRDTR